MQGEYIDAKFELLFIEQDLKPRFFPSRFLKQKFV